MKPSIHYNSQVAAETEQIVRECESASVRVRARVSVEVLALSYLDAQAQKYS